MSEKIDVAIIGGGISGLMVAYGLLKKTKKLKILIYDKGHRIEKRYCPLLNSQDKKCKECNPCSIMNGLAGAGAFSDGKFIISTEYGGNLQDYIGNKKAIEYMKELDEILKEFGAPDMIYEPNHALIDLCKENDLHIKKGIIKHFGTENNLMIMGKLIEYLSKYCTIINDCEVTDVNPIYHKIYLKEKKTIHANHIVFATGRSGSVFFSNWCKKYHVKTYSRYVDIGVRIELRSETWQHISSISYDPKISYISKLYNDETRMFCFNYGGQVVIENTFEAKTVNGHAYKDVKKHSPNSNFALLTRIEFSKPFNNPNEYINLIAKSANYISGGTVIVQRFGDLKNGRRTTEDKLKNSTIQPTLKSAYAGDLSLCIPKRQLDSIIETINKLDLIAPGTAHDDTLVYGVEGKYYSSIAEMNNFEIGAFEKIYGCGDGCGITRSLAQAGANGLYISDLIYQKIE